MFLVSSRIFSPVRKPDLIVDARPFEPRRAGEFRTGICTHCGSVATKEAHFKEDGFIIVERYCDSCLEPAKFGKITEWRSLFKSL